MRRRFYRFLYHLLYNQLACVYDPISWLVSAGRWGRWQRAVLPFVHGERVLEVGFGTGELLPLLAADVHSRRQVLGLDLSAAMHRITAEKLAWPVASSGHGEGSIWPVQGRVQKMPFTSQSIDTIVCTFPAGFILEPATLREFRRVLVPEGRLIVADVQLNARNRFVRLFLSLLFPATPKVRERYYTISSATGFRSTDHVFGEGPLQVVVTVSEGRAW